MLAPNNNGQCQSWQTITFTRGDTAGFKFQRLDTDGNVIMQIADELYFTVKTQFTNQGFVLQKTLDDMTFDEDGFYHFVIEPEDTNALKFADYVYDIETIQGGVKSTPLKGKFVMTPESTWQANEGGNNG